MNGKPTAAATVFVDADNTLWDTDGVYAAAQLGLLAAVEEAVGVAAPAADRLGYIRALDQDLAERHHAGLRYPPHLLTHALALALRGEAGPSAVRRALKDLTASSALEPSAAAAAVDGFFSALKALPETRPGVKAGLKRLHDLRCLIIVVTEGAQARVARTAEALQLAPFINRIIEAPKQTRLYQRVARLSHAPDPMFMVGDQLQRDIAPAKAAGLETIYFPGNFAPRWEPAEDAVRPDHRIETFDAVPPLVAARLRSQDRSNPGRPSSLAPGEASVRRP